MALEKRLSDMEWWEILLKLIATLIIVPLGGAIIAPFGAFANSFFSNALQALFEWIWNL